MVGESYDEGRGEAYAAMKNKHAKLQKYIQSTCYNHTRQRLTIESDDTGHQSCMQPFVTHLKLGTIIPYIRK